MLTDTFPALALALEPAESQVMNRAPRRPDEAILSRAFLLRILMYGALITGATMAAFVWALVNAPELATTVAFTPSPSHRSFTWGTRVARIPCWTCGVLRRTPTRWAPSDYRYCCRLRRCTSSRWRVSCASPPLDGSAWLVVGCCALVPAVAGQALKIWRPQL